MKILFLCNKSPWPPKEGAPMAMNMLIEGLLSSGHQVKVLAVNSFKYNISAGEIPAAYRDKTGIELIDVDLRVKPAAAFLNLFTSESYHINRFISGKFRQRLTEVLQSTTFDVVQLETLFMCPYIETIRQYSGARVVLRAHNIEHLIWQRIAGETTNPLKRWYISHLARTLKLYEEDVITRVDGIMAITPTDASFFRKSTRGQSNEKNNPQKPVNQHSCIPVADLPFGVDPANYPCTPGEVEYPSLFSLGSMNWIPNMEGIRWFLFNVWPDIHKQFPALKYYLAGREMPGWMLHLNLPNVIVLGEVEDAAAFLSSKAIMIVPLFSGSGIRIKIIEGMAAGKTIISTSLGAEGIQYTNHENILIANAACEFFDMISICIADKGLFEKVGKQARALIQTHYLPQNLIQNLLAFYKQLAG
ncbi:MAG: glycosyltransferase family 4 protein [Bacteroidota bacterium]